LKNQRQQFFQGKEKNMDPQLNKPTPSESRSSVVGIGLAIGLAIGSGIGMVYGYAIDNVTLGLVLGGGGGMLIGLSISSALANRNK
jgi:hypothetical protein